MQTVQLQTWVKRRAIQYETAGQFKDAISCWKRFLHQLPDEDLRDQAYVHFRLGLIHRQLHQRVLALYHLKTATQLNDEESKYFESYGMVYLQLGHWRLAKNQFQKAVHLEPMNATYWRQYAAILLKLGREALAFKAAKVALEIDPSNHKNHWTFVQILVEMNRWPEVASYLKKWKKLYPKSEERNQCEDFCKKRFGLSTQGAVLKQLKKLALDNDPSFDLHKFVRAQDRWLEFCQRNALFTKRKTNLRQVRTWSTALAHVSEYDFAQDGLRELCEEFSADYMDVEAAVRLLKESG